MMCDEYSFIIMIKIKILKSNLLLSKKLQLLSNTFYFNIAILLYLLYIDFSYSNLKMGLISFILEKKLCQNSYNQFWNENDKFQIYVKIYFSILKLLMFKFLSGFSKQKTLSKYNIFHVQV